MPFWPVSVEPMESKIITFGQRSRNSFFTDCENTTADDAMTNSEPRSMLSLGVELAQRLDQRPPHGVARHHDVGELLTLDELPRLAGVEPLLEDRGVALEEEAHAAPLAGAVHQRGERQAPQLDAPAGGSPIGQEAVVGDRLVGVGVVAAAEGEEHVLLAPHDALGHAGGAARVTDVEVVAAARTEVAVGRRGPAAPRRSRSTPSHGPRSEIRVFIGPACRRAPRSTRSPRSASWTSAARPASLHR